jgi:hypothetical protein
MLFFIVQFITTLNAQPDFSTIRIKEDYSFQVKIQKPILTKAYFVRVPSTSFSRDTNKILLTKIHDVLNLELNQPEKRTSDFLIYDTIEKINTRENEFVDFELDYMIIDPLVETDRLFVRVQNPENSDVAVFAMEGSDFLNSSPQIIKLENLSGLSKKMLNLMLKLEDFAFFKLFQSWNKKDEFIKQITIDCREVNIFSLIDLECLLENEKLWHPDTIITLNRRE